MTTRAARSVVAGLVGLCLVAAVASCGTSSPPITNSASAALDRQVQAIRAAATQQDPATAEAQLAQLRASVGQLEAQGQLSSVRAASILSAADAVGAQLATVTTPAPTTTSTTARPAKPDKGKGGHGGGLAGGAGGGAGGGPGGGAGGGPGGGAGGG